jgi:hypothetical protein
VGLNPFNRRFGVRSAIALLLVADLVAVLGAWFLLGNTIRSCTFRGPEFDRSLWSSTVGEPCNARLSMTDDLVDYHLTPGTSRSDVVALLGEPDPDSSRWGDRSLGYIVGFDIIDNLWLVVEFDGTWRLTHAGVYQD